MAPRINTMERVSLSDDDDEGRVLIQSYANSSFTLLRQNRPRFNGTNHLMIPLWPFSDCDLSSRQVNRFISTVETPQALHHHLLLRRGEDDPDL